MTDEPAKEAAREGSLDAPLRHPIDWRNEAFYDESATGEVDGVAKADYKKVVDACTLCDMCFMTKCPYVPPHPFDVDFPHLMLRYRAAELRAGRKDFIARQLAEMDRNGRIS